MSESVNDVDKKRSGYNDDQGNGTRPYKHFKKNSCRF